ncbi:MAG: beta-L-arabinofuranosidase domain-containing protein, partial [Acidimicrobiales bacterium]
MDRREFLFTMGSAAVTASGVSHGAAVPTTSLKQQPLRFGDVKLTSGLLHDRYALNAHRTFAISPDDILMPFLRAKGMPSRGKELNGDFAPTVQTGRWPGLYSTLWLSGAAHIARWSGDSSQRQTLTRMVHELAETKEPDGFLLAMGRSPDQRWAHTD